MEENLKFKHGASGYSASGPDGLMGESGNSSHFSAYSLKSDIDTIEEKISDSSTLTSNENYPEQEEYYNVGDIILDVYGNVGLIKEISPDVEIINLGNILFNTEYSAPKIDGQCILNFNIDSGAQYSQEDYIKHASDDNKFNSPLWHHRWHNPGVDAFGFKLTPDSNDTHDNGQTTKAFIESLLEENNHPPCKICVLFRNGLSFEKIIKDKNDIFIIIYCGYFNMIDTDITKISPYTQFSQEYNPNNGNVVYKKFILSNNNPLCDLYFEFINKGKTYRMKINVKQNENV